MFRLNFTTRVLGKAAARKLLYQEVTQTLRASSSDVISGNHRGLMEIALDSHLVGIAQRLSVGPIALGELTIDDAQRGGFNSISELILALRRAGYRFKPIEKYSLFKVRFEWVGGKK